MSFTEVDKIEVSWVNPSKILVFHLSYSIAMYVFHSKLLLVFTALWSYNGRLEGQLLLVRD